MLAPRAPSAFVCLRCELKLARPRPSHANFSASASARRHDAAAELEALAPREPVAGQDKKTDPLRITREYTRKGKLIRQRKAVLGGLKRMDEDADILVINEQPGPEEPEETQPELLEPISVPDILSSLQAEGAPATHEDVAKQLDSLRPVRDRLDEPHYVTTADFVKLVAALTRGFTVKQLSHYYSAAKNIKQETVYSAVKATVKATKRSEWHPTTTSIGTRLPGIETIKNPKARAKTVRKATLVDKILRDVWRLELLEEIEAPGELELRLKEWQLKVLQAGANETALTRIAKIRNAKVEIHWPTHVLRITADKNTAEYTANDIEEALSNAQTTSLDLRPWLTRLDKARLPLDNNLTSIFAHDIDLVSSLTRAHITILDQHIVRIHGLDETSVAEAERTLIGLLPFKDSAIRTIDTQRLDAAKDKSYLLPTFHESKSLNHAHRGLNLGRWALPVARSEEVEAQSEQEQSTHSLTNQIVSFMQPPVDGSYTGSESTPRNRQTGYWALEPEYKVSADFGQVLFPSECSNPNQAAEAALDSSKSPFQPAIPGLGSLLASSDFQNLSRTETPALLYHFIPAPDQKGFESGPGQLLPHLHIQVRTGRDGNRPTIHKLSLAFQERVHDVLLPDQAADIRFYRYGRLRFSSKSHHDKNVEEWSEAVRQNIEGGGRLSAPSLTIDIPKWTIPGFPTDAKGMLPVKYLFSGIQFRQSVTGKLLDTQISYSTVQSGKLGAKGGVLSAYCPKLTGDEYETQIRDFATKCLHMVDYITQAGAQTQPIRQTVLPRNEYSARKQRRAALQASEDRAPDEEQDPDQRQHQTLVESQDDADNQDNLDTYDETESYLTQDDSASIASRLDGEAPAASTADAAQLEAHGIDTERREAQSQDMQRQEADALLSDLFADDEPVAETGAESNAGKKDEGSLK